MKKYTVNMVAKATVDGIVQCVGLRSTEEWDIPELARDFAEALIAAGLIVAYRVIMKTHEDSTFYYNHPYCKLRSVDDEDLPWFTGVGRHSFVVNLKPVVDK